MIKLIATIASFTFLAALIPFLIINTVLTLKLWKKNYVLINEIAGKAPTKFRDRAKFMMESNPSWIFACSFIHTWYMYAMLRYGWKISKVDIIQWHKEIKIIFDKLYIYIYINNLLVNILITSFPIMLIFIYLSRI